MEINFERGGTLPKKKSKLLKTSIFGSKNEENQKQTKQKAKRDRKRKSLKKAGKDDEGHEVKTAHLMTLNSLVNDMILMGIVKTIYADRILISLPGRLIGRVPITHISKAYLEFLQSTIDEEDLLDKPKSLSEMFYVGQILYTKVLDKCHGEKQDILLSLLPEDINSEITSTMLNKGSVLLCAIQEAEDHGYFIETGIKGIRGFLPKKNIKSEPKVGELLYCKVQKVSESIITFTAFKKGDQIKVDTAEVPNLKTLLPSTIVNFNVVQLLKNGVEGLLFDGSIIAYANESYVPSKLSLDSNLIGKELKARILYTMPLSNQLYVTLNIDESTNKRILYGTIVENARVVKQTNSGVLFKLDNNESAVLPRKTIVKNYKNNFDVDTAMLKFSPNSTHTIRIMDYNEYEQCYLCTNNEKALKEKYFGTYDLQIGQLVQAKIVEKFQNSLKLSIGNVKGFLSGVLYHKLSKNDVGSEIRVRIAEIDHNEKLVQVTNLQGFLRESCKILDSKTKAKVGESYTGVVLSDKEKQFTILFFNHLKGILVKSKDTEADIISIGGLKEGSVKMFEIQKVKGDKIFLTVPKKVETQNLGKIFEGNVKAILPTSGVQIFINDLKAYGKIPKTLLSEFSELSDPILSAIKENSKFQVVALGNNQYSRRDVKYFNNKNVPTDFNDVKPNDVLRCFVKSSNLKFIELECPLKNFNETIRLNKDAFDNPENLALNTGDIVYVNVISKTEGHSNSLYVTPSLSKVWRSNNESLDMLANYLDDMSLLVNNLKEADKSVGQYSIGQRISGTVHGIIGNNVLIELEGNVYAQGTVDNVHIYKVGSKIKEAVVVWIDPINQILYVTTVEKCKDEISIDQDIDEKLVCEKKHKAIIVYFNDYVTVCTIRKQGQPLIYVPTKHHYNDFSTSTNRALGNAASKLIIKRVNNGKMLGVFVQDDKVFQKLEKIKQKIDQKPTVKRKMTNSISETICEEEIIKHPKVILEDSEDENENRVEENLSKNNDTNKNEHKSNNNSKKDFQKTLKKKAKNTLKTIGGKVKRAAEISKPGKKVINKDSLLDDDLVNLISYKKIKEGQISSVIEKKHDKVLSKSTIGKKKKPKRLVKK